MGGLGSNSSRSEQMKRAASKTFAIFLSTNNRSLVWTPSVLCVDAPTLGKVERKV